MNANNLGSLALILYDFNNGNILPVMDKKLPTGKKSMIMKIIGTIEGLENIGCVVISFQDGKIVLSYQLNDIKHYLLISSFKIKEDMIQLKSIDITGKIYIMCISEITDLCLDKFNCKILIPKCNWDYIL